MHIFVSIEMLHITSHVMCVCIDAILMGSLTGRCIAMVSIFGATE